MLEISKSYLTCRTFLTAMNSNVEMIHYALLTGSLSWS